jgi:hypothetical protein
LEVERPLLVDHVVLDGNVHVLGRHHIALMQYSVRQSNVAQTKPWQSEHFFDGWYSLIPMTEPKSTKRK